MNIKFILKLFHFIDQYNAMMDDIKNNKLLNSVSIQVFLMNKLKTSIFI